jgi:hypothetical protein
MPKADKALGRGPKKMLRLANLQDLFSALSARGYQLAGPTARDGAIVYDRLASVQNLPVGWSDEQDGGTYRLRRRDDGTLFGYSVGPHSRKRFLLRPVTMLWQAKRSDKGFERRITSYPAAIDITEEVRAIRADEGAAVSDAGRAHERGEET